MTLYEMPVVMNLYARIAPGELFRLLRRNLGVRAHEGIYTPRVLLWMMMLQRLDRRGTLASSVEQLVQGQLDGLLSCCKRVRKKKISLATGGYCQARQNLPKVLVERSMEEILQRLRNHLSEASQPLEHTVYVLDGSSVQLDHNPELARAYPTAKNQHGSSHWPVVRLVVLQDVETGLAERPHWGPMYGPKAVSEQALAQQAMEALPAQSVIVGDRNFGIYAIACGARQRGHDVVIRMTTVRAQRLHGGLLSQPGEEAVEWRASRWDRVDPEKLASDRSIPGRLISRRIGRGKKQEWLHVFTTLTIPAEQVVELYGRRWNVETDLRSLKQAVRLHRLTVQSVDMMEKELLVAILAYNLVRALMCLAARKTGVHPRQLSFTYAHNIVSDGIATVLSAPTEREKLKRLQRLIDLISRCKLYQRKRPSYPRAVWRQGFRYPYRKHEN